MSSKEFTRQQFHWLHQVKDDRELPVTAVFIALELTKFFNEADEGGAAWPSCKTIAHGIGKSEETARRVLHLLEKQGHLKIEWGQPGRGHSSRYWMCIKPSPVVGVLEQQKPSPTVGVLEEGKPSKMESKTLIREGENPQKRILKPSPAVRENLLNRTSLRTFLEEDSISRPSAVSGKRKTKPPSDSDFETFWSNYPRRVAKGAARKAYERIIGNGEATAAELLYGAMRYSAERDSEDQKYTRYPATWLNGEGWRDESTSSRSGWPANIQRGLDMVPDDDDERGPR